MGGLVSLQCRKMKSVHVNCTGSQSETEQANLVLNTEINEADVAENDL